MPSVNQFEIGEQFNRWTVISEREGQPQKSGKVLTAYRCRCQCGQEGLVLAWCLKTGRSKSCGCLKSEITSLRMSKPWMPPRTRLYKVWSNMIQRCANQNKSDYEHYGGRGITVCEEWRKDYMAFHGWAMANGYSDDLEIDRRENSQGYSPSNCRFVTHQVNCQNRRPRRWFRKPVEL